MYPHFLSHLIVDLTHEDLERRLRMARRQYRYDPDQFEEAPALQPDPVYMGLRQAIASGPIGRLMQWFERRAEDREDRAFNQRIDATVKRAERSTIEPLPASTGDAPDEERTAA